jgi:curved DNA-binding protein CbpA
MSDPYKVLGITRDATDEEVKQAYREMAKKYHPDNYAGNPLADLVNEKMKEINEAYDQIQNERAGSTYTGGTGSLADIRRLILEGRSAEAELMLNSIAQDKRNAEWNYLKGRVLLARGWYNDARKHFDAACYMDPGNSEYKSTQGELRRHERSGNGRVYRQSGNNSGCSGCDVCTSLICADCLCECCGGDLISCC